jgi:dihydroorotate dehydrogenase electron transfer subunit
MEPESAMINETVEVLWNRKVGSNYFKIGLTCAPQYVHSVAGQFVMLKTVNHMTPLLRRPFSIHRLILSGEDILGIEILCKLVGKGTQQLYEMRKGDTLDMVGPLGNGFAILKKTCRAILIAGGIGVAPMLYLAQSMQKKGMDLGRCDLFLGGQTAGDLLCVDDFVQLGMPVHVTTDDGSQGEACLVTDPVFKIADHQQTDVIYACGPMPMLQCVAEMLKPHRIPCQVSIETLMACGIGACVGCAVAPKNGETYLHACVDGPVFDISRLKL